VLHVAIYTHFRPLAFKENGRLKGVDVDILRLFAKQQGLRVKFHQHNTFDKVWLEVLNGQIDVAAGGIGRMPAREHPHIEWSQPYMKVQRTIVVNPKCWNGRHRGKTIRGTPGSVGWLDMVAMASVAKLEPGKSERQDIRDLLSCKIHGLMRGTISAMAIIKRHPQLKMEQPWETVVDVGPLGEVFCFPVSKESHLAEALSSFLTHMQASGDLDRIIKKYI